LWFTIAGRNFKTHIIHCQVLQVWAWLHVKLETGNILKFWKGRSIGSWNGCQNSSKEMVCCLNEHLAISFLLNLSGTGKISCWLLDAAMQERKWELRLSINQGEIFWGVRVRNIP
jgi:hypothetical protein